MNRNLTLRMAKWLVVRFTLVVTAGGFLSNISVAQMTLDSCQQLARKNYPLVLQYKLIEQTRDYTLKNANTNYLPQLDVTLIGGIVEGMQDLGMPGSKPEESDFKGIAMVQINQALWDGGATRHVKQMTREKSTIELAEVDVSLYALRDRVNNLYFGVLLIDEQLKTFDELEKSLLRNKERVKNAIDGGIAYQSDLDEIEVELVNIDSKKAELHSNRTAYINVLSAMLGISLADVTFSKPEELAMNASPAIVRPELQLLEAQKSFIEAQQRLNRSALFPKIGLMGFGIFIQPGISFGASELDNILIGGLSASWNINGLYKHGNNQKINALSLQKVEVQKETFLFNTNLELTRLTGETLKYQTTLEKDKKLITLKGNIAKAYESKYENGVVTMSQLLDKISDESMARQQMSLHEMQYLLNQYQYQNSEGVSLQP